MATNIRPTRHRAVSFDQAKIPKVFSVPFIAVLMSSNLLQQVRCRKRAPPQQSRQEVHSENSGEVLMHETLTP
jgi:hypothetical protein